MGNQPGIKRHDGNLDRHFGAFAQCAIGESYGLGRAKSANLQTDGAFDSAEKVRRSEDGDPVLS